MHKTKMLLQPIKAGKTALVTGTPVFLGTALMVFGAESIWISVGGLILSESGLIGALLLLLRPQRRMYAAYGMFVLTFTIVIDALAFILYAIIKMSLGSQHPLFL